MVVVQAQRLRRWRAPWIIAILPPYLLRVRRRVGRVSPASAQAILARILPLTLGDALKAGEYAIIQSLDVDAASFVTNWEDYEDGTREETLDFASRYLCGYVRKNMDPVLESVKVTVELILRRQTLE